MKSLRARIALLVAGSIVGVVALAMLVATFVTGSAPPVRKLEPVARHIIALAEGAGQSAAVRIAEAPAGGIPDPPHQAFLSGAMTGIGATNDVRVTRIAHGEPGILASVRLTDGRWLITEIPDLSPPRERFLILGGWMLAVLVGATALALTISSKVTRPMGVLEAAASRITADATLAPVPEDGPTEVRATARALNHLASRLRAAMESRMRLVAAAGHDLRTPMTRMRLRAEFLPEDEREKWLADIEELDMIADSAMRLVREETAGDEPVPLAFDELVEGIVDEIGEIGLPVTLKGAEPVAIKAGAFGLRRALRNLVNNAATHGRGAEVRVALRSGKAVLAIADRGPGIPPDQIERAFEPFYRADPARAKSVPGAGLGLAIAKEIVERNGGQIELRNREGGGLHQIVIFPALPPERQSAAKQ